MPLLVFHNSSNSPTSNRTWCIHKHDMTLPLSFIHARPGHFNLDPKTRTGIDPKSQVQVQVQVCVD